MPVILPHHLLQYLHGIDADQIDMDAARDYWSHVQKHTDWGRVHPCPAGQPCNPLFVYGDDVKFNNNEKLTCVCMGYILSEKKGLSLRTHFPLFVIRQVLDVKLMPHPEPWGSGVERV